MSGNCDRCRSTNWWAPYEASFATHKGGYRHRITSGIGRRLGTASGNNWTRKMASSIAIEAPAQNGLIGLADSFVMSKPTTSFYQVKPAAIMHRIRDYNA